jgi:hypothetical protein
VKSRASQALPSYEPKAVYLTLSVPLALMIKNTDLQQELSSEICRSFKAFRAATCLYDSRLRRLSNRSACVSYNRKLLASTQKDPLNSFLSRVILEQQRVGCPVQTIRDSTHPKFPAITIVCCSPNSGVSVH